MSQQMNKQENGTAATTVEAFSVVYRRSHGRLINSMTALTRNREEAEDIAAAAFAAAFRNLGTFCGESSLDTWVHTIARHEVGNWRRRSGKNAPVCIGETFALEPSEPDLLARTLERLECCERIRVALRRIPLIYRRMLVDHFVGGMSTRGIARRHRIPLGTVLSRLFKAKRLLRVAWEA